MEKKEQEKDLSANKGTDDFRNIIKLEPENEDENLDDSESMNGIDDILPKEETPIAKVSEPSEKQGGLTGKDIQDIKELDSRIKENNNAIKKLEEKLGSISDDMNDLIGLYEIVSGQMNPFVGLSKVTKKRLDVLENFDKEIDSLRTRLDKMESLVGKIDLNEDNSKDFTSVDDIDSLIERAIDSVLERRKIDEIIERAIESIKIGATPSIDMGV